MTDYKPGTVAAIRIRDRFEGLALRTNSGGWAWVPNDWEGAFCGVSVTAHVTDVRPLVVLDLAPLGPSGIDYPTTFRDAAQDAAHIGKTGLACILRNLAAQIEAQTKPPKPPEPTGLGAVVEDADGSRMVRVTSGTGLLTPWSCGGSARWAWDDIDAVRVLSDGVRP